MRDVVQVFRRASRPRLERVQGRGARRRLGSDRLLTQVGPSKTRRLSSEVGWQLESRQIRDCDANLPPGSAEALNEQESNLWEHQCLMKKQIKMFNKEKAFSSLCKDLDPFK